MKIYKVIMGKASGQSLISALVAMAIMGIIMGAFASMLRSQQRETSALNDKLAAISLKNLLLTTLSSGSVCTFELNNPIIKTFDSSSAASIAAASISLSQIHASANALAPLVAQANTKASPDSNSLWILPQASNGIQVTNFVGSGSTYTANLIVNFDKTKLVRPIKPITIPLTLTVNNAVPTATTITGCMQPTAAPGNIQILASASWTAGSGLVTSSGILSVVPVGNARQITFTNPLPDNKYMVIANGSLALNCCYEQLFATSKTTAGFLVRGAYAINDDPINYLDFIVVKSP